MLQGARTTLIAERSTNHPPFHLYSIFHLNAMYSSIEETRREDVIHACYWPLLRLAKDVGYLGIEASAETVLEIERLDARWLEELRLLLSEGRCEFVGSGYAQVVAPLVPAEVSRANLRLGNEVYADLLGIQPRIALVNEQAYSAGLVPLYLEAGYQAIIMEWNNPARMHPEWPPGTERFPQRAVGPGRETIPVIWNDTVAFQQFQAYAHRETGLGEYLQFLSRCASRGNGALCLYGSDAEVFDFRPGRFRTETPTGQDEWGRIASLFHAIAADRTFRLVEPSAVLDLLSEPNAGAPLRLESAAVPIPVKKQPKYNASRWAVTGRDDLRTNTSCWRIFDGLRRNGEKDDGLWRELCSLWGGDYRTHITERRWTSFLDRLEVLERKVAGDEPPGSCAAQAFRRPARSLVETDGQWLMVRLGPTAVRLNQRRGLAVDALWFGETDRPPLLCTLPHGYFDDIRLAADFYTGLTVVEIPGHRRITDLSWAETKWHEDPASGVVVVEGVIPTDVGPVHKRIAVLDDPPSLSLRYAFEWEPLPPATVRTGAALANPEAFDQATLFYRTHNGGPVPETFLLERTEVSHDQAVSTLISSSHVVGATEGWIEMGDARQGVRISIDRSVSGAVPLVSHHPVRDSFFYRVSWSLAEYDDTTRQSAKPAPSGILLTITPTLSQNDES